MLVLDGGSGALTDSAVRELPRFLEPGDLLVFNDTRVVAARLAGVKPSGGRVEILLERALAGPEALAQLSASKPIRAGLEVHTAGGTVRVLAREDELWRIALPAPALPFFERFGRVPAAAVHPPRAGCPRPRALPEPLCARARRGRRSHGESALRRAAARGAPRARRPLRLDHVARGGRHLPAAAHRRHRFPYHARRARLGECRDR